MKFTINKNTDFEKLASEMSESYILSIFTAINNVLEQNKDNKSFEMDVDIDIHVNINNKK